MSIISDYWFSNGGGGPVPPDPPGNIGNSLRFRGGQFLITTTLGVPNNDFTYSVWVKSAIMAAGGGLIGSNTGVNDGYSYHATGAIRSRTNAGWGTDLSDGLLRDPSAWYHLVFQNNSGTTTLFINGVQQSSTSATFASSSTTIIGAANSNVPDEPFRGYMAGDVYMIDGQLLEPTAFGRENDDGVWVPREVDFASATMRWSDFLTVSNGTFETPAQNAFNGLLDDGDGRCFTSTGADLTWAPPVATPATFTTTLEIFNTNTAGQQNITWNGNTVVPTGGWVTVFTDPSPDPDNPNVIDASQPLVIAATSNASRAELHAVRLDGKVVLNPFMWSGQLTADNGATVVEADEAFKDSNLSTSTSAPASITFTPSPEIACTTFGIQHQEPDMTVSINGGAAQPCVGANGSFTDFDVPGGKLTTAVVSRNNGTQILNWQRTRLNGVGLLLDGVNNSYGTNGFHLDFADPDDLGADRSGNGNDFTATGFNTDRVGIFSQSMTGPNGFAAGQGAANAFVDPNSQNPNGTFARAANNGDTITFEPPGGIPYTNGYQIKAVFCDLKVNGVQKQTMTSADAIYFEAGSGTIEKVEFVGSASRPEINYFLINPGSEQSSSPNPPPAGFYLADNTGVDSDLMEDGPSQNYSTLNPLAVSNPAEGKQYENASLGLIAPNLPMFASTLAMPNGTGIYYWELQNQTATGGIGVCSVNSRLRDFDIADENTLITDNGTVVLNGTVNSGAWNNGAFGGGLNQVYGCQYNSNTRRVRFYLGGQQPTYSGVVPVGDNEFDVPAAWGDVYAMGTAAAASGSVSINYGQQAGFLFQPAGTVALQTQNLPEVKIRNGRDHFRALTGPGNGADGSVVAGQRAGNWSQDLTTNNPGGFQTPAANAFNGSTADPACMSGNPDGRLTWSPREDVVFTGDLEVFCKAGLTSESYIASWNGNSVNYTHNTWVTVASGGGTINAATPLTIQADPADQAALAGVKVGGEILVDLGILAQAQSTFATGLWWIKDRVNSNQHQLVDSVRGGNQAMTTPGLVTGAYVAPAGNSVAWCWNFDDPAVNGFDIQQTTQAQTQNHNLGVVPDFIITGAINRIGAGSLPSWRVFHTSVGTGEAFLLNTNEAASPHAERITAVTDTTFTYPGIDANYIHYLFRAVPGYSAFGSFVGNGQPSGPMIWTGFRPSFVMVKRVDGNANWQIMDSTINTSNPANIWIEANEPTGEQTGNAFIQEDFLSNGFKPRGGASQQDNLAGETYIYCCFAENPTGGSNVSPANAR